MKTISLAALVAIVPLICASQLPEKAGDLVTKLKNWELEQQASFQKTIHEKRLQVVAALESELTLATKSGDLEGALAIKKAIEELAKPIYEGAPMKPLPTSQPKRATVNGTNNLLANPSFEDDQTGWTFTSVNRRGTATVDTKESRDGKSSIRIENALEDDSFLKQTVTVKPLTRYRFTGWVKTKDVAPKVTDHSGAALSLDASFEHTESITGSKNWTEVSFEFDTGNVDSVRVGPRLGQRATAGTAWFDDLSLVEVGPASRRK